MNKVNVENVKTTGLCDDNDYDDDLGLFEVDSS